MIAESGKNSGRVIGLDFAHHSPHAAAGCIALILQLWNGLAQSCTLIITTVRECMPGSQAPQLSAPSHIMAPDDVQFNINTVA